MKFIALMVFFVFLAGCSSGREQPFPCYLITKEVVGITSLESENGLYKIEAPYFETTIRPVTCSP